MRIFSYNILDGGEGRADPLAEIIQAQNADVVSLVEADNLQVVERIANRLDMDYVHAPGNAHAAALLSRFPIRQSINHAPSLPEIKNTLLETVVVDSAGVEWTFVSVHLHAHATELDEAHREKELVVILELLSPHREANRPHFLLGDFNAVSPRQRIDISKCKPRTQKEWQENGGRLPRRAIQRILDAGYVDSFDAVTNDTALGTFSTQFPGQRVDYIFTYGVEPGRLKSAWIEQDRLARYASDHFPVGLELVPC